ncbi:polymeric immunoglobulin receptor-like [Anableps anableps]
MSERCCATVNKTQSTEEDSVSIRCPYDSESVNKLKYICRGNQPSTCLQQAVITSNNTQNGQFRLTDDRKSRIFTMTISSLTLKDSGPYLCGVQRNSGLDVFSAVELEVKKWCCVKAIDVSGSVGRPVTFQCPYPPHHRNEPMSLCKGDGARSCTDTMDQSRFILNDVSPSSFSVTVTKLEAGDAGTYWCRSGPEASVGDSTHFHLSVKPECEPSLMKVTAEAVGGVTVYQRGERAANDPLSCLYDSLEPLPFCSYAAAIPYCDAVCQQALDG